MRSDCDHPSKTREVGHQAFRREVPGMQKALAIGENLRSVCVEHEVPGSILNTVQIIRVNGRYALVGARHQVKPLPTTQASGDAGETGSGGSSRSLPELNVGGAKVGCVARAFGLFLFP